MKTRIFAYDDYRDALIPGREEAGLAMAADALRAANDLLWSKGIPVRLFPVAGEDGEDGAVLQCGIEDWPLR